jgi:mono/diheme cytochrome c family protein
MNRWKTIVVVILLTGCTRTLPPTASPAERVEKIPLTQGTAIPKPEPTSQIPDPLLEDYKNATVCDFTTEIPEPPERTDILLQSGEKVFQTNCSLCHGAKLKGDGESSRTLEPPPTDLTNPDNYKYGHDAQSIYRITAFGIEGTAMAPWDGILTPNEIWAVSFYVESRLDSNDQGR